MPDVNPSGVPRVLQRLKRWIRWRMDKAPDGRATKRPVGSTKDVDKLLSFAAATAPESSATEGFGFVFTGRVVIDGRTYFAGDMDACRQPDDGELAPWAQEVVDHYQTFVEVTPSRVGLRLWLCTKNPPKGLARTKMPVAAPVPVGVEKNPEFQLFGMGHAQYVTVTGVQQKGSKNYIAEVDNLDWLIERFGLQEQDEAGPEMAAGDGPEPELDVIDERVRRAPHGDDMVDGDWHTVLGESKGSASEVYFRLVQHVMRAARGHGEAAVRYLLQRTAWGKGTIEESADPARYMRESWVRKEVARVSGKKAGPAIEDVFDVMPAAAPAAPDPVLVHDLWKHGAALIEGRNQDTFLVHGLIPKTGLTQFFGDPASGKTPFALSLAVHVAAGLPTWFGHAIDNPGPVAYMVGEDLDGVAHRLKAEYEALGLDPKAVPLWASLRPGRLVDPDEVEKWVRSVRKWSPQGISLLVVDTQAANFGGNENSNEDAQAFVNNLNAISLHLGCANALVHHKGHHDKERGRGGSAVFAGVYCAFDVTRDGSVVQAASVKEKNWAKPEPLVGTLVPVVTGQDSKGRDVTAITLVTKAPETLDAFEPIAADMEGDDAGWRVFWQLEGLAGAEVSRAELAGACATTDKVVRNRLRKLESLGLVRAKQGPSKTSQTSYPLTEKGLRVADLERAKLMGEVDASVDSFVDNTKGQEEGQVDNEYP